MASLIQHFVDYPASF